MLETNSHHGFDCTQYRCDHCGEGFLRFIGDVVGPSSPYPHRCDRCGFEQDFEELYPILDNY